MPPRIRKTLPTGLAVLFALTVLPTAAQEPLPLPLSGPPLELATRAYEASARGDNAAAVALVREALRQRPDSVQLRVQLVDALIASGDLRAAQVEAEAIDVGDGRRAERLATIREQSAFRADRQSFDSLDYRDAMGPQPTAPDPAFESADAAYRALRGGRAAAAVDLAREAIRLAPDRRAYRLLLVEALMAARRPTEAEVVLSDLIAGEPDADLLTQRGNLRLQGGDPAGALSDFEAALRLGGGTASSRRGLRLAAADAALATGQPQAALDALAPLGGERSYAVASRTGFALLALDQRREALAAFEIARVAARSQAERALAIRSIISLMTETGRREEARAMLTASLADGSLAGTADVDVAYLANGVGDDATALTYFERAAAAGDLHGRAYLDAAYAAKRRVRNDRAVDFFRAGIDAIEAGTLKADAKRLFGLRREVAEISRTWGAYFSATYGAVGVAPTSTTAPTPSGGRNVGQIGGEVYWRPPVIGYRDGALVELFARAFQTVYDERGGRTGAETTQGYLGARWKPFGNWNLIFEGARLVRLGNASREDWLARAAFSAGEGTDLDVVDRYWHTWQVYGEVDRFFEAAQNIAQFEGRAGYSVRLDELSDKLVATPFLALGASYDSSFAVQSAVGAGPGIGLRYWFREDAYNAPRSYVDLNVQYRFKIAGDDSARGVFAGLTVAY